MKKIGKVMLIAFCLWIAGMILFGIGFRYAHKAAAKNNAPVDYVKKEYVCKDAAKIDVIRTELTSEAVTVEKISGDDIVVTYFVNEEKPAIKVHDQSGALIVEKIPYDYQKGEFFHVTDIFAYIQNGNYDMDYRDVVIGVPEKFRGEYEIGLVSGNLKLEDVPAKEDISVNLSSGSVKLSDLEVAGNVSVHGISGSIKVENVTSAGDQTYEATSGSINLDHVSCDGTIDCSEISGRIKGDRVSAKNLICETTSGGIDFDELTLAKSFDGKSISGAIRLGLTDSAHDYDVRIDSLAGSANCEKGKDPGAPKTIMAETTSGSVTITFNK